MVTYKTVLGAYRGANQTGRGVLLSTLRRWSLGELFRSGSAAHAFMKRDTHDRAIAKAEMRRRFIEALGKPRTKRCAPCIKRRISCYAVPVAISRSAKCSACLLSGASCCGERKETTIDITGDAETGVLDSRSLQQVRRDDRTCGNAAPGERHRWGLAIAPPRDHDYPPSVRVRFNQRGRIVTHDRGAGAGPHSPLSLTRTPSPKPQARIVYRDEESEPEQDGVKDDNNTTEEDDSDLD